MKMSGRDGVHDFVRRTSLPDAADKKYIYIYIGVRARGYSHRRRADIIQYNVGPSDIIWSPRSQPDSASD